MPGAHHGQKKVLTFILGIEVIDGCEPLCGCWTLNLGPSEEQPMLVTAEKFLKP